MERINKKLIQDLISDAQSSERKRKNYNIHKEANDPLQRLLNAMEPGTYVQPHKHENPDKRELFIVFRGRILLVEFNDDGTVRDHQILDPDTEDYAAEIAPGTYHSLISLKEGTVSLEVKDGPYDPADDKHFASWAPKEGSPECEHYLSTLLKKLGI